MFFFPPTKISPVLMAPTKKPGSARSQLHDKEFSPEEAFLDKDFQNQIRHLCSDLKSPYREVATAHFCEEKTAAEIAKAQNKNTKTVQTQIYRARSMLKALLERSD